MFFIKNKKSDFEKYCFQKNIFQKNNKALIRIKPKIKMQKIKYKEHKNKSQIKIVNKKCKSVHKLNIFKKYEKRKSQTTHKRHILII